VAATAQAHATIKPAGDFKELDITASTPGQTVPAELASASPRPRAPVINMNHQNGNQPRPTH